MMTAVKKDGATPQVQYSKLVQQFNAAPPGKLYCLHGKTGGVFRLSLYMASHALLRGMPVALVDGTNRFDAYYIAEFARRVTSQRLVRQRVTPEQLLRHIYVARAFTCYQMEATITERLPAFLRRSGATIAIIFGLLDTYYDEQAPLFEVKASVGRVIAALQQLKADKTAVLLASLDMKPESKERGQLFPRVTSTMDHVLELAEDESGYRLSEREGLYHGPHSTNIHHGHPGRDGNMDQVPARIAPGRPGGAG